MPLASSDRILSSDLTPFTACSPFTRASIRLVMSATLPDILAVSLPPPFVPDASMLSMTLTCAPAEIPLSLFFSARVNTLVSVVFSLVSSFSYMSVMLLSALPILPSISVILPVRPFTWL